MPRSSPAAPTTGDTWMWSQPGGLAGLVHGGAHAGLSAPTGRVVVQETTAGGKHCQAGDPMRCGPLISRTPPIIHFFRSAT